MAAGVAPPSASAAEPPTSSCASSWVGSWGRSAAQQGDREFERQTIRMISNVTAGGSQVRLRLSNLFGDQPVTFDTVTVGLQRAGTHNASAAVAGSVRPVTFNGRPSVTIPPGQTLRSDAVDLTVERFDNLVTSLYVAGATGTTTAHGETQQTAYVADGDHTRDTSSDAFTALPPGGTPSVVWHYFLTDIDVLAAGGAGTVVTLGDSITNGTESTIDTNRRYPDYLARRLQRAGSAMAVSNQGIGGDEVVQPTLPGLPGGPGMVHRLDRDVLSQPGLRSVILLGGINDIGRHAEPQADKVIAGMRTIIDRVHAAGVKIYGATLTPSGDLEEGFIVPTYSTPYANQQRAQVNDFVRNGGAFDGVIDFDRVLRDETDPDRLQDRFDSGDHLHPNDAGYEAMANAVELQGLRGASTSACASAPAPALATTPATPGSSRPCSSRRRVTYTLRRGARLRTVTVEGKRVPAARRGRKVTVNLAGRPRGTVRVRLTYRTRGGRTRTRTSTLRLCSRR